MKRRGDHRRTDDGTGGHQGWTFSKSSRRPEYVGCHPRALRVRALDAGRSMAKIAPNGPKRSGPARSGGLGGSGGFSAVRLLNGLRPVRRNPVAADAIDGYRHAAAPRLEPRGSRCELDAF
ncbi:hypothetical protein Ssi03_03630 [Sphaerisporangium siamense]|nr:hypothetical protein Ssi03_03630 [Sphaerisporangium siamense]